MKTAVYFKHFLSVFAALSLVCIVSSCKDQNFDWENAHAMTMHQQFNDVFIKEFGKPAPGHQWGFDYASIAMGSSLISQSYTRAAYKGETMISDIDNTKPNNIRLYEYFGQPERPGKKEHDEVYAFFKHHKVYWEKTPTYYMEGKADSEISRSDNTRQLQEGKSKAYFDLHLWEIHTGYSKLFSSTEDLVNKLRNGNETEKKNAEDYLKTKGVTSEFFEFLNADGTMDLVSLKNSTKKIADKDDSSKQISLYEYFFRYSMGFGSLYDHRDVNELENSRIGTTISFTNAWIQDIANDRASDGGENDEIDLNGSAHDAAQMDYLEVWDYSSDNFGKSKMANNHLNDWNGAQGYGWAKNSSGQNASFVIAADNNNWTYECSNASAIKHDKYYIVYLKGDGYEGYYLGFDYEAYKPGANTNEIVPANGVCNDWIIKLVNFADITNMNPARIFCEDLGGDGNVVDTGHGIHTSDIDYNDIVLDVDNKNDRDVVTLTLQAAGGTLPLAVVYDNTPLFETHEMFGNNWDWTEATSKGRTNVDYSIMYNTENNTVTEEAKTFTLYFNGKTGTATSHKKQFGAGVKFELAKLRLFVYRHGVEDYQATNPTSVIEAEWVDLGNEDGDAPLKLYVPTDTKWLKERSSIKLGYPKFMDWVKDPLQRFWEKEKHAEYLVGGGSGSNNTTGN